MSYPQAFILSLVQGLTEFLPISSSGHLALLQKLFGFEKPSILFDIFVHVGTLGAVIFYLKKELAVFGKIRIWGLVILGSIPAGLVGLFLNNRIETIFNSPNLVGFSFLITAGILFSTRAVGKLTKSIGKLSPTDALLVGLFQALAILPGVSRSGSTIVAGLWTGLDRRTAFRFSFFLAIPAILGALFLQIPKALTQESLAVSSSYCLQAILGMVLAGIIGYGALKILETLLFQAKLWIFGIYCAIIGLLAILI